MTDAELDALAVKVAAALQQHVMPAVLPRTIGDLLRADLGHGPMYWTHMIPLAGLHVIQVAYTLSPDGSILIELKDINGQRVWQGQLVSE
jgi:hypothetical protein